MRRIGWVTAALTTAAAGFAACGDDDDGDQGNASATAGEKSREALVIKRRVKILPQKAGGPADTGKVQSGSKLGNSDFCPGGAGTGEDPGQTGSWAHIVTYSCPDGRLKVGFNNDPPDKDGVVRGEWGVISGTGSFAGATGAGRLVVKFDRPTSRLGRETYTGTITR